MEKSLSVSTTQTALFCAIGLALSNSAWAKANEPSSPTTLDEVVVWGTKVSSDSESIGADDMSLKQADHMSDLLRDVPGVDVGGTHSLNQRINMRGLNETKLDIRLDGASQHANMFHHIGNLTLNPDILKAVDIHVGNNSVTQNGLGGAVYFETKDATDLLRYGEQFGARAYGGFGSNDSRQGSLALYGMLTEDVDAMVYGHLVRRGNFEDGTGKEAFGTAGDVYNVLAKLGYEPSVNQRLEVSYDLYSDEGDYSPRPDMNGDANDKITGDLLLPTVYERNTATLGYMLDGEQHYGKATLYTSVSEIERDERKTGWARHKRESINTATNRNTGFNATFHFDSTLVDRGNTLTYGIDYMDKSSSSAYGDAQYMDESAVSTALFVEDKLYITDAWSITAGLRYDDYRRKAATSNKDFDGVTWSLASHLAINENWSAFASTRSLFKGPELLETFVRYQQIAFLADDIKAETGLNSQVGLSYANRFDSHRVGFNLSAFETQIDDYIIEQWAPDYSEMSIENSGDVEIRGVELSATYGYENLATKLSYAKADTHYADTGLPVMKNGRSIDVGDSMSLTVDYHADSIDTLFGWTSTLVLEEDNVTQGAAKKEGYHVHTLYAQWLPADIENLTLTFGIDNLFDEEYVSHASRSGLAGRKQTLTDDFEPGRNVKLSVAYQF